MVVVEDEMIYELFIRHAFDVEANDDPGRLANAGYFKISLISQVKAAVAYAMNVYAKNGLTIDIELYVERVIDAQNLSDIIAVIKEFQSHLH